MSAFHHTGAVISRAEQPLGQPDQHSTGAFAVILLLCQYSLHCVLSWSELPDCSLGPHTYVFWEIRKQFWLPSVARPPSFSEGSSREDSLSSSCGRQARCSFGWSSNQSHGFLDVQWTPKSLISSVTATCSVSVTWQVWTAHVPGTL